MERALTLYQTTIGKKAVVALTGVILVGFVVGHMLGNMNAYAGEEAFNGYAAALREVPAGPPVTYSELAERAGNVAAIRAAAACCAQNAAALFVPCHRVIRSNGELGGFRYGLDIKESLIDRENDL